MILSLTEVFVRFPGLDRWLMGGLWHGSFDGPVRRRAATVPVEIVRCKTMPGQDGGELQVLARIDAGEEAGPGGDRLRLHLRLERADGLERITGATFRTWVGCDCPTVNACVHSAAVFHALTMAAATGSVPGAGGKRKAGGGASRSASYRQEEGDEGEQRRGGPGGLGGDLESWLSGVSEAAGESGRDGTAGGVKSEDDSRFLAYCLEPRRSGDEAVEAAGRGMTSVLMRIRDGRWKKEGRVIDSNRLAAIDLSNPPPYVTAEDVLWSTRIRRLRVREQMLEAWTEVRGEGWADILEQAARAGRLFVRREDGNQPEAVHHEALEWGRQELVEAAWETQPDGAIRPVLRLASEGGVLLPTLPLFYLDVERGVLGRAHGDMGSAGLLAWAEGPEVPQKRVEAVRRRISELRGVAPLPEPVVEDVVAVTGTQPSPGVRVGPRPVGVFEKVMVVAELYFRYPDCEVEFVSGRDTFSRQSWMEKGKRVILERNADFEEACVRRLEEAGLRRLGETMSPFEITAETRHFFAPPLPMPSALDWLKIIHAEDFAALEGEGWDVDIEAKAGLAIHDVEMVVPQLEGDPRGIDWFRFDLKGEYAGKSVSLMPQIAQAISEDWLERYADPAAVPESFLIPCEEPEDGVIRFPARRFLDIVAKVQELNALREGQGEGLLLHKATASGVAHEFGLRETETMRTLAALGARLSGGEPLQAAPQPADVKATMRPYQLDGFRWLGFLGANGLHGILADDMGLGKTLQTLAHIAARREEADGKPSLVLAPTSVVTNWAAEAAKFVPHLRVLVLQGPGRARHFGEIPYADLVLTSYALLARDSEELEAHEWDVLALDEAQHIKNARARTTRHACALQAAHRICLSGTPMENHLGELWSLFQFLMPGFLPESGRYTALFRAPIEREGCQRAQAALNRLVAPLILRRTKDEVAADLPPKTHLTHPIDLSAAQTDLYESYRALMDKMVRTAVAARGLAQSHLIVLDALLKLRQICCHPVLLGDDAGVPPGTGSAKLEYLIEDLLPQLIEEGRRILLFSQFTSMLEIIESRVRDKGWTYLKLTGSTKNRGELVARFQEGADPLFLISLKAGGTGLNLTAADTVILHDPWWNPAVENQATDRAHRIGQVKPVFVHKLVCRGTIEERILELQSKKAHLARALLAGDVSKLRMDEEVLSGLLAPAR